MDVVLRPRELERRGIGIQPCQGEIDLRFFFYDFVDLIASRLGPESRCLRLEIKKNKYLRMYF